MTSTPGPRIRPLLEQFSDVERADALDRLARAAADGDDSAAADLAWAVRRFRLAHPALRRYLLSDADLDAGEQRVLLAVAYRIGSFRSESRFTTWLHQVAANEAKQLIRRERRHSDRVEPGDPADYGEHFVGRVSSMVVDRTVVRAEIMKLTQNHRSALVLREDDGLTYDEIASQLGIPVSTAKTWVRRGRSELAVRLRDSLVGTEPPPSGTR